MTSTSVMFVELSGTIFSNSGNAELVPKQYLCRSVCPCEGCRVGIS
jgi:hypothetical protein